MKLLTFEETTVKVFFVWVHKLVPTEPIFFVPEIGTLPST